jgi:hypothetical protein
MAQRKSCTAFLQALHDQHKQHEWLEMDAARPYPTF